MCWRAGVVLLLGISIATVHAAFFEEHMMSHLGTTDHHEFRRKLHVAARQVQEEVEEFAASGQGKSEYLEWRRSLEEDYVSTLDSDLSESGGRRRLEVMDTTTGGVSTALQPPALNSAPGPADLNITFFRHESVQSSELVDWRLSSTTRTPVFDQAACESCWLWAAADIISIKWSLLMNFLTPVPMSPQHICDCGFKRCCGGGWPEWTFRFARTNKGAAPLSAYPYVARDNQRCGAVNSSLLTGSITGWEKLPANTPSALKKTISQHPALVLIHASSSFRRYTGGIFMGTDCPRRPSLNHAVIVVGFNLTGPEPYWIAKNSWGTGWGEAGYIRITALRQICGFGSEPSMYPTMFRVKTACDAVPPPCGAGVCYLEKDNITPRCNCTAGFVEKRERVPKCVTATPCNAPINPCAFGTCSNGFDGSYTCLCPAGTIIGTRADGAETCIVNSFQSGLLTTVAVEGDNATILALTYNVTDQQLLIMNPFINMSATIPAGTVVVVGGPLSGLGCGATDIVQLNDSCTAISDRNGLTVPRLLMINPGLNCSQLRLSQHLCIRPGQVARTSPFERSCGLSYLTDQNDTCITVAEQFNTSTMMLEWLNPGLNCLRGFPITNLCVAPLLLGMVGLTCYDQYNVTQSDTCFTIAQNANLPMSEFLKLNPGVRCAGPHWVVGLTVCLNGTNTPASELALEPNVRTYYVRVNDTLLRIASQFPQCDNGQGGFYNDTELITNICWANSWLPFDCSDRRVVVGSIILIPCARAIGATTCRSVPQNRTGVSFCQANICVCGNNAITYISDSCASIAFATPAMGWNACGSCGSYCGGHSGRTIFQAWGAVTTGCPDQFCPFPISQPPSPSLSSQLCSQNGASSAQCQLARFICSRAVQAQPLDGTSSSLGCWNFRNCLNRMGFNNVNCPRTASLRCKIPEDFGSAITSLPYACASCMY